MKFIHCPTKIYFKILMSFTYQLNNCSCQQINSNQQQKEKSMHHHFYQENIRMDDENKRKLNHYDQSTNQPKLYKRTVLSSRTNIAADKSKIQQISNSISQLLSVIKQPKVKHAHVELGQNQIGFQDYRRRILQLQKLQQNYEKQEQLRIKRAAQYIEMQVQRKRFSQQCNDENQYHNKLSIDDRLPVSRPSVPANSTQRTKSKSSKFLLKSTSKYIRQITPPKFSKYCRPIQDIQPEKKIDVANTISQPRLKQYISFNVSERRQIEQKKQIPNQVIEQINDQSSFQIKQQKPQQQIKKISEVKQKAEDENVTYTMPETEIENKITFSEMDERMQTPINILEESKKDQVDQSIEFKVYPCDLTKDTVKPFIANHFASVVNLDIQFAAMKQHFIDSQFKQKFNISQKRFHLLKVLWDRGLFVDEKNLDNLIDFQVENEVQSEQKSRQNQSLFSFLQIFVNKYLQAQNQWQKKVVHMLTKHQIQTTSFKPGFLDLENRGYLKAQDLSCFMNLYATNSPYYKNKHVKQLFWRFCRYESEPEKLSYEGFMYIIAGKI